MNYFENCATMNDAKHLYRELAKENHPDRGGNLRTMQEINAQFAAWCADFMKRESRERQKTAHAENRKSAADYHDMDEIGKDIQTMIEWALNLEGVDVELMGAWVWLTGDTRRHAETLKAWNAEHETKWKYSGNKKAWYFAGVPSFSRREKSLDEIRNTYGSRTFTRGQKQQEERQTLHA